METRLAKKKRIDASLETGLGASTPLEETEINNEQNNYVNAIFGNDLIFDIIGDNLGIPDLKILRQTCKLLLTKVNWHRKFIPNMTITVTDETIRETNMSPQHSLDWKSVKLFIEHLSPKIFANIPTLALQDLQLRQSVKTDHIPPRPMELLSHRSACYKWLKSSNLNLMSLTLDVNLLIYSMPTTALTSVVDTVKELRFVGQFREYYFGKALPTSKRKTLVNNLDMIGNLNWRLRSISAKSGIGAEALGRIISSSAETIEKIETRFTINISVFLTTQFACLRELELNLNDEEEILAAEFLNRQLKLESLKLRVCGEVTPELLEAVRRNCSPKLHTLVIEGFGTLKTFPDSHSWSFIQDLNGLKRFELSHRSLEDYTKCGILNYLPATLQSLEIGGRYRFKDIPLQEVQAIVISNLSGFPHLTLLKIDSHFINDDMLQSICTVQIRLRTFHFSLSEISDFGLTGKRRGGTLDSGISLRNLKGLNELKMNFRSSRITQEGLVTAIQFKELRVLSVPDFYLEDENLLTIAANNPSLECVTQTVMKEDSDQRVLFSKFLRVNPRLTRTISDTEEDPDSDSESEFESSSVSSADKICTRPSYGVPSRILDEPTIERVRNTMKIADRGDGCFPKFSYHYDL